MDEQLESNNNKLSSTPKDVNKNNNLLEYFNKPDTVFELINEDKFGDLFSSKEEFFSKIQINSNEYKLLLAACFSVAKENKELSIVLDISSELISRYIFGLLIFLNRGLPFDIIKMLCFTVTDSKIKIRKIDTIEFVQKKSRAKDGSYNIIFNFVSGNSNLIDTKPGQHLYLDFVWNNLNDAVRLNNFKSMAEIINENKVDLVEYDELVEIFITNENRYMLSDNERKQNLKNFYTVIINNTEFSRRQRYASLFFNIFEAELEKKKVNRRSYLPLEEIIQMIISFYDVVDLFFDEALGEVIKKKINAYLILIILDGKDEGKLTYVSKVFLMAHGNKLMFKNIIDNLFINQKFVDEILKWYILMRLAEANSLSKLLGEVKFWGEVSAKVIAMDFFAEHIEYNILNILKAADNKIALCIEVYNYFDNFTSSYATDEDKNIYLGYSQKIKNSIYLYMFEVIDLSKIKKDELLGIKLQSCGNYEDKQKVIYFVQNLITDEKSAYMRTFEKELCKLSKDVVFNIQNIIKEYYLSDLSEYNFRRIMTAFVEGEVYVNNIILYNFIDIIKYLYNNGGAEKSRKYIAWIADEFKELENTMVYNRFKSAVITYFREYDIKAFAEKSANEIFQNIKNTNVRTLLKETKKHMPSSFQRMLGRMTNPYK